MRRAIALHRRGHWPEEAALDSVTLAFLDRHRRRIRLVADSGAPFLLEKLTKKAGRQLMCSKEDCDYLRDAPLEEPEAAVPA